MTSFGGNFRNVDFPRPNTRKRQRKCMDADFPAAYLEEPSIGFRFPVVHAALLQIIPHVLDSAVTAYGPEILLLAESMLAHVDEIWMWMV